MEEKRVTEAIVEEVKGENQYHYDAFISYRHSDLDKFVAENLHKKLEAFRMPQSVMKKRQGQKNRIERVFRDKEELPLTSDLNDPIMTALHNSDWLIVICSPRLRESLWCRKEIETFVQLRGRERVLAVLIEGEPAESFPDELLFKTEKVTKPDGSVEEVKIPVEPLAADVRGKNKGEMLKAMKTEVLRILAAMFHLNYDDLRQRHHEQQHKKKMAVVWSVAIVSILFAVFCSVIAIHLNKKNQTIQRLADQVLEQQADMKYEQALADADLSMRTLESGDREKAIQIAFEALTQKEYITMPYTPEAQYALAASLRAYDDGNAYCAKYQFETMGIIRSMKMSQDGQFLAMVDETGTFTVLCIETQEVVLELGREEQNTFTEECYVFLADNRIAYLNKNDEITVYDLVNENERIIEVCAGRFTADKDGLYLLAETGAAECVLYDGMTLDCIGTAPKFENVFRTEYLAVSKEGMLVCAYRLQGTTDTILYCIDGNTMEIRFSTVLTNRNVKDVVVDENKVYALAGYEGSERGEANAYICALDMQTGQILWEDEQKGCYAGFLCLTEQKDTLFMATDCNMSIYLTNDGTVSYRKFVEEKPISAEDYISCYGVFLADGSYILADKDIPEYIDLSREFQCRTDNNIQYCIREELIVALKDNDYRITVYTKEAAAAVVPTTDIVNRAEYFCYDEDVAVFKAEEYGLENATYVHTLFFDTEKKYIFASYWNGDFVMYDIYGEYIIHKTENCDTMIGYLGTDLNGNIYVRSEDCGYMLTPEGHLVMSIPNMVALNAEQNKVYMETARGLSEAPIYTVMELLQLAAPYVDASDDIDMSVYEDVSSEQ